ncbi:MAG: hypothetical protein KGH57_04200 [Candidatus Micrarchaeota archaeon]|nr:hypothetical protein [Candidatus Micrarchaeota archaeon]
MLMTGSGESPTKERTKLRALEVAAQVQADLKQPLRDRIDLHRSNTLRLIEKFPQQQAEELVNAEEDHLIREERRLTKEATGILTKEEKKLDSMLKKTSDYIRDSSAVENVLQGMRIASALAFGISLDKNPVINEASYVFFGLTAAGALINYHRNKTRYDRKVRREEHKVKRFLIKAEETAERAFAIHRNGNGHNNHHSP